MIPYFLYTPQVINNNLSLNQNYWDNYLLINPIYNNPNFANGSSNNNPNFQQSFNMNNNEALTLLKNHEINRNQQFNNLNSQYTNDLNQEYKKHLILDNVKILF